MIPVCLTIAGSDCSAGAGMQADLKTAYALGCYALTAVTCVVSERPGHVGSVVPMEAAFVAEQVQECLAAFPVAAVKTGMLYSADIVRAVADALPTDIPLVVDPVMVATAGEQLMLSEAQAAYEQLLFPRAILITPNLDEIMRLSRRVDPILSLTELEQTAAQLAAGYHCAVLAKGGHLPGHTCADVLAQPDGSGRIWTHPRSEGISTHGTGCTLSAAIAAMLARGNDLESAVEHALQYTARAIAASHQWAHSYALNHGAPGAPHSGKNWQ